MEKDYKKILWKIQELWEKYYQPTVIPDSIQNLNISKNYDNNGVSKYHDRFYFVDRFSFTESKKTVFSDDYGQYKGLAKFQVLIDDGRLIYLFDNHNEILYPLVEISKATGVQYDVVHIDAHPDDAVFKGEKAQSLGLKNIKEYIAQTRISDFFDAISGVSLEEIKKSQDCHSGFDPESRNLIGDIHRITHSDSFEFFLPPEKPYILSLDIDIFGPEGDFCELQDKVRAIAIACSRADAVCIAMSPGFIDQGFAREIIELFMK